MPRSWPTPRPSSSWEPRRCGRIASWHEQPERLDRMPRDERVKTRCLALIVAMLCGTSAFPVESRTLAVGSRVRVTTPLAGTGPLIGTVVGIEPDAVSVRGGSSGSALRIPVTPATTLEVSGGKRSRAGRGAMLGAAVGVMPGLLMTFGDYNTDDGSPGAVAALGAAAGAAVGAAVGWALRSEQWLPAEMPSVAAGIAPLRGGATFSLRVAWGKRQPQVR